MKKLFLIILFVTLFFPAKVFSQTITIPIPTISVTPSPGPTPVNYELPYPGILPGSPLYGLKMLRDRINDLLTSNSLKKSNFYLLQADKRLAATLMLFEKEEDKLAIETLSKGLSYLGKSYNKMLEAKKANEGVSDIYLKIKSSLAKHLEEIDKLQEKAKGEDKELLRKEYQTVLEIQNKVNSFKPE